MIAGFLATAGGASAQPVPIDLYSTGMVPGGGALAPAGAPDGNYALIFAPPTFPIFVPATVVGPAMPAAWLANDAASQWINPDSLGSGPSTFHPGGTYVYETIFDLTGLDHSTVAISLDWMADDNTVIDGVIAINGTLVPSSGTGPGPGSWSAFTSIAFGSATPGLGAAFLPGLNSLTFTVTNEQTLLIPTGPTGVRVHILSATAELIPSPGAGTQIALAGLIAVGRTRRGAV